MKNFFVVYLLFVALGINAQGYKHFTIENGLLSNRIYKVIQDKEGFIWIATDKGVSKFDGKSFKNFTTKDGLPSNDIWELVNMPDHKTWFFTRAGKLGYIDKDKVYNFANPDKETFYPDAILHSKNSVGLRSGGQNYRFKKNK